MWVCDTGIEIYGYSLWKVHFLSSLLLCLGYNFQCDAKQLVRSYESLECFKHYEMLLDIQNLFNEARGGLSGLTKVTFKRTTASFSQSLNC